jgi:hypothetical protein
MGRTSPRQARPSAAEALGAIPPADLHRVELDPLAGDLSGFGRAEVRIVGFGPAEVETRHFGRRRVEFDLLGVGGAAGSGYSAS